MKNQALSFVLAVLVVLTGVSLKQSLAGIGGAPVPIPKVADSIGGAPVPIPKYGVSIGGAPVPIPKNAASIGGAPVPIPKNGAGSTETR